MLAEKADSAAAVERAGRDNQAITSDGAERNVGYPVRPHEVERFLKMLRSTAQRMDKTELAVLEDALREYAASRE